jgi:hypothetical protein
MIAELAIELAAVFPDGPEVFASPRLTRLVRFGAFTISRRPPLQGIGMSPLPPQARAAKVGVAEYRIYQMPVEGRKTAMSVLPSPS